MSASTKKARRRSPGEGGVFEYKLVNGQVRFGIKFVLTLEDGTRKTVLRRRDENGQPWTTKKAAQAAVREAISKVEKGQWIDPSQQPLGDYLAEWVAGHRKIGDSTRASYSKNIRLHITPHIGALPLASLTPGRIAKLYRELETSGRRDHKAGAGLSARTVRYIHTILSAGLKAAVKAKLIGHNPAEDPDLCSPPTAKEAKPPEMHPWSAAQLRTFLDWSKTGSALHLGWYVLAMTGMRRGELLALRWRDIDLEARTLSIRRSVGVVRVKGQKALLKEGDTKTTKPRVVDLDESTVAMLKAHKRERGGLALLLARDDALVFGDAEGQWRHPERFSRSFKEHLTRCRKWLEKSGVDLPNVRLHDLRHTHATLLLAKGVPVKVVSERLGHASPTVTLTVYAHVMPGNQRDAADQFASLVAEA